MGLQGMGLLGVTCVHSKLKCHRIKLRQRLSWTRASMGHRSITTQMLVPAFLDEQKGVGEGERPCGGRDLKYPLIFFFNLLIKMQ